MPSGGAGGDGAGEGGRHYQQEEGAGGQQAGGGAPGPPQQESQLGTRQVFLLPFSYWVHEGGGVFYVAESHSSPIGCGIMLF